MRTAARELDIQGLLDSWDRNNMVLVNLLHAIPNGGLEAIAMEGSPSVAGMLTHICGVRLASVEEGASESGRNLPEQDLAAREPGRIEQMLNESAKAVRDALRRRLAASEGGDLHRDHTIRRFEYMVLHERYHYSQIKLALQMAGQPIPDEAAVDHLTSFDARGVKTV